MKLALTQTGDRGATYRLVAHEPRVILGLFLQPFLSFLLGFTLFPAVDYVSRLNDGSRAAGLLDGAIAFGMGTGVTGLLVTALGVCPALLWLLPRGSVTRGHILVGGALVGTVPGVIAFAARLATLPLSSADDLAAGSFGASDPSLPFGIANALGGMAVGSVIGLGCAACFWFIARSRVDHEPL